MRAGKEATSLKQQPSQQIIPPSLVLILMSFLVDQTLNQILRGTELVFVGFMNALFVGFGPNA